MCIITCYVGPFMMNECLSVQDSIHERMRINGNCDDIEWLRVLCGYSSNSVLSEFLVHVGRLLLPHVAERPNHHVHSLHAYIQLV